MVFMVYTLLTRFFQAYRSKQKGSDYRKKLAGKSTTLLLCHGEAETAPHQLHLSGKRMQLRYLCSIYMHI